MNYEEQRKQRLMTVLSAAVRIGRAGALPDSVVAAELNDLAELYLAAAHVPYGVIGKGLAAIPIHNPDFKGMEVQMPSEADRYIADLMTQGFRQVVPEPVPSNEPRVADAQTRLSDACCEFEAPGDDMHDHICQKAKGHADGPGASDHLCESCGVLYDAVGGTAAPLLMGAVSVDNGPAEEPGELEL